MSLTSRLGEGRRYRKQPDERRNTFSHPKAILRAFGISNEKLAAAGLKLRFARRNEFYFCSQSEISVRQPPDLRTLLVSHEGQYLPYRSILTGCFLLPLLAAPRWKIARSKISFHQTLVRCSWIEIEVCRSKQRRISRRHLDITGEISSRGTELVIGRGGVVSRGWLCGSGDRRRLDDFLLTGEARNGCGDPNGEKDWDAHQFAGSFGSGAERSGTNTGSTLARSHCWDGSGKCSRDCCRPDELDDGPVSVSPLAWRNAPTIGRKVMESPSTTEKKYQSKRATAPSELTANIAAPATIERSQLDCFLFVLAWRAPVGPPPAIPQRYWFAICVNKTSVRRVN